MRYVLTLFLQVVSSVAFSKCFGAFIVTIVVSTFKILKKKKKKKKNKIFKKIWARNLFSVTMGNMLPYGSEKIFGVKLSSLNNQYKVSEG